MRDYGVIDQGKGRGGDRICLYFGRQSQQNLQFNWTWLVREKEGEKDNTKDFGLSKWVDGIAFT